MHRLLPWALLLTALLPSVWFAWTARELPHLGYARRDSLVLNGANSIAQGHGYRNASDPGEPLLTQVPPLFPAYLAPVAASPALLVVALWILAPCALALLYAWLRQQALSPEKAALLCLLVGSSGPFVLGSASVLPDLLAFALLLAALFLIEQESKSATLLAALATSAAYLTQASLAVALVALPAYLLYRRRPLQAALFATIAAVAAVFWHWTPLTLNLPSLPVAALFVVSGYGLFRTPQFTAYHAFGVPFLLFAADPLPLLPLLFLGFFELLSFRFALPVFAALTLVYNASNFVPLKRMIELDRAAQPLRNQAYYWIDAHTPLNARFLSADPASLHIGARRQGYLLSSSEPADYVFLTPQDPAFPFPIVYSNEAIVILRKSTIIKK